MQVMLPGLLLQGVQCSFKPFRGRRLSLVQVSGHRASGWTTRFALARAHGEDLSAGQLHAQVAIAGALDPRRIGDRRCSEDTHSG